ncbi:MAG: hypothetical protein OEV64_11305 [Desulfobulbaceae bacterium]|nr:hypothetical protein [Desulfobulbaceae bacterium]
MRLLVEEAESRTAILDALLEQVDLIVHATVVVVTQAVSTDTIETASGAVVSPDELTQHFTTKVLHPNTKIEFVTHRFAPFRPRHV